METLRIEPATERAKRVLLLGATGTIGRATARALSSSGHEAVCFVRAPLDQQAASGVEYRHGHPADLVSLARDGIRGERFDAIVSCLSSRTGVPADAWAIDYQAHMNALLAAKAAGIGQFILLSAICVQKPKLEFQRAKLAFESALIASGLTYSIVRPTAYFKSLSGQVERVRNGKPFLLFGDGTLTACKPIANDDLAAYIVECLNRSDRHGCILPVGGPGPAITPRDQGEHLFSLFGRKPKFVRVPAGVLRGAAHVLGAIGRVVPAAATKAELARIGHYYATESMLVLDPATGRYDAAATPSTGTQTLFEFYARLVAGTDSADRGAHAVF
jgi:divinyl chlorophyllide a 8-vinyl-reductase